MVSRETLRRDLRLAGVDAIGDEALQRLLDLTRILEERAVPRGFVATGDRGRVVPRHILESAAVLQWLPREGSVVDVGSGAGLPGLVLACLREDPVVLVEAQARRAAFLRETAHQLGIQVEVLHASAEDAARGALREAASAATARALARPPVALELTLPFVAPEGMVALLTGPQDGVAMAAAGAASDVLGGSVPRLERFEVPGANEARWVMIVQKLRNTPDRFPRPPGPRRRRPAGGDVV